MTLLIIFYILSSIGGIFMLKAYKSNKKETILFFSITTFGAVLWGSILLQHPLDFNKAIGWMLSRLL